MAIVGSMQSVDSQFDVRQNHVDIFEVHLETAVFSCVGHCIAIGCLKKLQLEPDGLN